MINYKCAKCGATLESPGSMAGQQDKCPICGQVCVVPQPRNRVPIILAACGGGVAVVVLVVAAVWLWPHRNESAGQPSEQLSRAPLAAHPKPKMEPKPKPSPKVQPKPKPVTKPATRAKVTEPLATKPSTKAARPPPTKVARKEAIRLVRTSLSRKDYNSQPPTGAVPYADLRQRGFWKVKPVDVLRGTRWKSAIPLGPTGGIVLFRDVLYFACRDRVHAVDAAAGTKLWAYRIKSGNRYVEIESCPTIVDNTAYFGVSIGGNYYYVYALDLRNRRLCWKFKTSGPVTGSPVIANGIAYFRSDCPSRIPAGRHFREFVWLYATDALTGQLQWKFNLESLGSSSPSVYKGSVYIADEEKIRALDAKTGKKMWFCEGSSPLAAPVASGEVVYACIGGDLVALDAKTGDVQWRVQNVSGLACSDSTLYCVRSPAEVFGDWQILAVREATREEIWKVSLDVYKITDLGVAGNMLFCVVWKGGSSDQHLVAIDTRNGKEKWRFSQEDLNVCMDYTFGDGVVYIAVSGKNQLYALQSLGVGSSKKAEARPLPKGNKPTGGAAKPPVTPPKPKPTTKPATQPKAAKPPTPTVRGLAKYLTLDVAKGVTMKLVLIPAGTFTMGSPKTEKGHSDGEGPQRKVTITKPFYMGVYEVTQEQYEAVVGKNPAYFKGAKNPVETVSWDDAVAFCKALSKKTGKVVRLPTEAEWEYACRPGTKTAFCFGDDQKQLGDYAWYTGNSGSKTHPVAQKKPNAWGLYDMHGNVWEWCSDWYADSYANAKAVDPQGAASGTLRVLRGGSWFSIPRGCRAAYRSGNNPDYRHIGSGFRVVVLSGSGVE